jgi:hypothetical protein
LFVFAIAIAIAIVIVFGLVFSHCVVVFLLYIHVQGHGDFFFKPQDLQAAIDNMQNAQASTDMSAMLSNLDSMLTIEPTTTTTAPAPAEEEEEA